MPTLLVNQKECRQAGLVGTCTEVLENIIRYLDLDSIKTLRLTSRVLSEQCLVPRFKRCFEHLTTELTPATLYSLSSLAASPQLRTAIRQLTIMATVYDTTQLKRTLLTKCAEGGPDSSAGTSNSECTEKEISTARADLAWMQAQQEQQEAFPDESAVESLAKALGPLERLDSIELDSIVFHGPNSTSPIEKGNWHQVWFRAIQVYRLTMSAIARSGVAVCSLNVFRREPSQCCVPSCDITRHMAKLDIDDFCAAGSHIKDFSLNTSMKVETDCRKLGAALEELKGAAYRRAVMRLGLLEADDPEAVAEDNFPGIARLLRCMPNLKSIDLHLRRMLEGVPMAYEKIFTAIADEVQMSMLRKCCLDGLLVNEESMLKFLGNHPRIEYLDLTEIHLTSGSWQPIFKFLCSNMPNLKLLRLSNLWDQCDQPLVHLHPIWAEDFPIDYFCLDPWYHPYTGGMLVHTGEFDVDDLRKGLEFQPRPTGDILSSPLRFKWSMTRAKRYGSPV